jgi:hypothetical protein
MSRKRAIDALAGRQTDRVAQLEFLAHEAFFRKVTGLDPYEKPNEAFLAFLESCKIDATLMPGLGRPRVRPGQMLRDGHHAYTAWGFKETPWLAEPIYKTPEEILAFDPRTHDASSLQEKTDRCCDGYERAQSLFGDRALYVPGHYQLVLHYMPFYCDWRVFMELLALESDRCRPLLDRCTDYSIEVFEAMARTPAPLIIAHEDLCSARGPIFSPEFLRREVFPRFARIYEPVKRAGKRLLAISDGFIEPIAADLMAAGADGLFIEPMNDIDRMIDLVGPGGIIVGGGDTRTLTTGTPEEVAAEVKTSIEKAKRLPGFFFCLGGEAPHNVPVENLEAYFDACRQYGTK